MDDRSLDDLLDRLVAEFADRAHAGPDPDRDDLVEQVPEAHREALQRCFRMIEAGLATAPRSGAALTPGEVVDGYRIQREIGRGGMSIVYLAEQLDLRRPVALKVLRPGLALERRHVDRFRREGLAIAKLKHPNIVQVYGVGEARGLHYLAMEYVSGTNLARVFEALPRADRRTADDLSRVAGIPAFDMSVMTYERAFCQLLAPVARAIGLAHELGLVHRDVKPSNILIHADGRAVIADFGLAKDDDDPGLSLTGEPLGTPSYMSPEQAALTEHHVDRRTDVYSLGVTLYEGLTGRRPFEGDSFMAVLEAIRTRAPVPVRGLVRGLGADVDAVIRRCMQRDPEGRYANCLDLATELTAIAEARRTQAGAAEGGLRNRLARVFAGVATVGYTTEYVSSRRFLGLPLVHVYRGPRMPGQGLRVAKGWFACGDLAIGVLALGPMACGFVCWGGLALGVFALGGIALGVVPLGGIALGALANGGLAAGYGAAGGIAFGVYAAGGLPHGTHLIGPGADSPEAEAFFTRWMPWWGWMFHYVAGES